MLTHQIEKSPEQQIYELRYTAYLEKASIKENSQHAFMDPYDTAPNCHSFIEYIEGFPAGSIRACIYQPERPDLGIPAQELFPDEMEAHIGFESRVVESNKFVVHPTYQHKALRLKFKLFKNVFDKALEVGADYIVTSPRATQVDFYKSMQFEPISGVKRSLALDFDVVLMACNLRVARQLVNDDPKYKTLRRFGLC
ncbi:N-acyl amino acid synthase FeeM domain-containing protein [Kordiimonas sp.]|uniref:N-acyl amino acid synthase FeeM domain-containing protein n=1 Tax=Kordiimonas sp. TaxID=1970157 RepID=UPI003A9193E5